MDVTKRSDYAFRLLRIAYENPGKYVSVTDVSEQLSIPYAFARGIQHDLVKSGLLVTARGSNGGFSLACNPSEVTVLEVIEVVQGPVGIAPCSNYAEPCSLQCACAFNRLWRGADAMLKAYFASITLEQLFTEMENHSSIQHALSGGGFSPVEK